MTSWVPIVSTLCGATAGGVYLLLSDMDFSFFWVFAFSWSFVCSALLYCALATVHSRSRLQSALCASSMCSAFVFRISDLFKFLVLNKPLDVRRMSSSLLCTSGTLLGVGLSSFFHDEILEFSKSFVKPSSGESPEIKPDHDEKHSTPELSELV